MTKRKPKRKKNRSKKARKSVTLRSSLLKAVAGIVITAILVVAVGLIVHYLIPSRQTTSPVPAKTMVAVKTPPKIEKPTFEIYPEEKAPIEKPAAKPKIPPGKNKRKMPDDETILKLIDEDGMKIIEAAQQFGVSREHYSREYNKIKKKRNFSVLSGL